VKSAIVFLGMVSPGGIISHFGLVASKGKVLAERDGHDFYFAATDKGDRLRDWEYVKANFTANRIIRAVKLTKVVQEIGKLFSDHEKIVIHFQGGRTQLKALIPLKKKYGVRCKLVAVTQYFRNDSWRRIPMSIYQYFMYSRYVDLVNFQSPYSARMFVGGQKLFKAGKATVIPMGCEMPATLDICPPSSLEGLRGDLEDAGLFKFVYLAAFRPGKRHEWLVRSLSEELRKHSDVRVLLCGTGADAVVQSVKRAVAELGLEHQVLLPGGIPHGDLPWLLAHSNAAIIPSCSETFGHAFVEPMMAGLPILGTRVGAGEYVIRDYETGLSIELGSPMTLRRGFRWMVENREKTRMMGKTAQRLAQIMFSFDEVAQMWHETYCDLLSR